MARHTLYAYALGKDLESVADEIERRVAKLIGNSQLRFGVPWFVDQRAFDDPSLHPGDLPTWELGLNVDLPDPPNEPKGWFHDIEQIAMLCGELYATTGRSFVIGIGDNERGVSEDLFTINSSQPDLGMLRRIIGVAESTS